MANKIIVENVSMNFGKLKVLDNISFDVKENEFISIVGPSGSGKTTLLHLIQGFTKQTKGFIKTHGKKGFVFQDHNLFPWKTIKENIEIKNNTKQDINIILENIGLEHFSNYYPNQVSEGMKQRAGIGRCLAYNSDILLMDESFGSLDYLTKLKVQEFLLKLWKKKGLTIIFVTHDIEEAIRLSDKIIVLSKLPAKILRIIKVDRKKGDSIKKEVLDLIQNDSNSMKNENPTY